jgi:hypothetical protein
MRSVVNIEISAKGDVTVEANGVRGSGCQALTRGIENALGTVTADTKKTEYFQQANADAGTRAEHKQ